MSISLSTPLRPSSRLRTATQRFMAQRAGSTTVEVESSHVVMMSHGKQVADVIERAADATG